MPQKIADLLTGQGWPEPNCPCIQLVFRHNEPVRLTSCSGKCRAEDD